MKRALAAGFALALWLGLNAPASAAFQLSISNPGTVAVGQAVNLTVSISWNGVGTNYLSTNGLFGAVFGVRRTAASTGSVTANPTPVLGTDVVPNPLLNSTFNQAVGAANMGTSPTGSNVIGAELIATTTAPTPADANAGTPLLIGTVRVVGGTAGLVTLAVEQLTPGSAGQFVSGTNQNLDDPTLTPLGSGGVTLGTTTFTVSAVPEPTSMALVGLAATGFVSSMWRKRRKGQTTPVETV